MTFKYKCLECGKEFTKDSKTWLNRQKYCPECAKERICARNRIAWRLRRDRELRKLRGGQDGRDSRAYI